MHIQPVTMPDITGVDLGGRIQAQVAVAAAVKTLGVQRQTGEALVALLDPKVGQNVNRAA